MILITQLYKSNKIRFTELLTALKKNIENKHITEVILLNEEYIELNLDKNLNSKKIRQEIVKERISYKLAFDYAEKNISIDEIVILSNADIWFDNTLSFIDNYDLNNKIIALSKYDLQKNGNYRLFNCIDSQDSWIFKNPICLQYNYNFQFGKGGCDNRIAWIMNNSKKNNIKYETINPAKTIQSYHEHLSNIRNWVHGEIKGPYHFIPIT